MARARLGSDRTVGRGQRRAGGDGQRCLVDDRRLGRRLIGQADHPGHRRGQVGRHRRVPGGQADRAPVGQVGPHQRHPEGRLHLGVGARHRDQQAAGRGPDLQSGRGQPRAGGGDGGRGRAEDRVELPRGQVLVVAGVARGGDGLHEGVEAGRVAGSQRHVHGDAGGRRARPEDVGVGRHARRSVPLKRHHGRRWRPRRRGRPPAWMRPPAPRRRRPRARRARPAGRFGIRITGAV